MPSRRRLFAGTVALVLAVAGGILAYRWWRDYLRYVRTDDAYVQAKVALITPRVSGTVVELPVNDNWQIKTGDLLVRLDPTDFRVKLRDAEAALAQARQQVAAMAARTRAADSDVALAQAELELAERDDARTRALFAKHEVSADIRDRDRTRLRVARSRLAAAREGAARARADLGIPLDAPVTDAPVVRRALAARDQAALKLSYTDLRAPIDGIVATRSVQIGQRVDPGQALMRVVPLQWAYVEANFKETQLADVRVGQPATVVSDLYPDYVYRGVVESLAPGTGAAFALLPPENATGNWIKIVQRVPVKIRFDEPPPSTHPLRVGVSVEVAIDISDKSGPLLQALDQPRQPGSPRR
jgi:membrane fusion protein, multidrug efflux system